MLYVKPIPSPETAALLELAQAPGIGAAALRKIIKSIDHPVGFYEKFYDSRGSVKNNVTAEAIVGRCIQEGIQIISPLDAHYPSPLLHIHDFPPFLFVKGNVECLSMPSCAVVGTREVSHLGTVWARQFAKMLVERNFSVVSGLALGVDTAAHQGALRGNGVTVAILAHGLDKITPASNRDLAAQILDSGGALVSEHPPGVPPRRQEYVRRNRIQSGLSVCSIIVESGEVGGTMYQGQFTQEQGRFLFCLLPSNSEPGADRFRYSGAEKLMRERGARAIRSRPDFERIIDSGELIKLYDTLHLMPRFEQNRLL